MLTTFDRYLMGRMLHTFVVFFVATYGLYIVIDLFTNIDAFQLEAQAAADEAQRSGNPWSAHYTLIDMTRRITLYYSYHLSEFLELAGPLLITIAAVAVLGLMEKHSESHPVLAAGVPAFRLLTPLLLTALALNIVLLVNQEVVMPRIAVSLQTPRGKEHTTKQSVTPVYDYSNHMMHIDGESVSVEEARLDGASFGLTKHLVQDGCTLRAESAIFLKQTPVHPSGWLLRNLTVVFDPDRLTAAGRDRILPRPNGKDIFVVSDVSFEQLYEQGKNPKLLSSLELVSRIRNPATGKPAVLRQSLALHSRVARPLLSLLSVMIALPLVLRRESGDLIINMAVCGVVLAAVFGFAQGSLLAGGANLIPPALAAWLPIVVTGTTSVWTSGYVQT
jgi:lipopolysaccharide export system permease protein